MLLRPIHHTFAPLADARFCTRALCLLFTPWKWKRGKERDELKKSLAKKFAADAFLFSSGREGLLALMKALNIHAGDEVIVPSYTCVVVPNAIAAVGANPIYVDIAKDHLSLDPDEVAKAVTPKTKAIICQHTFGLPAPLHELKKICDKHHLPLIEDCAHIIPDDDADIGMVGNVTLLSFGRDKAVSGVTGGAIVLRGARDEMRRKLQDLEDSAQECSLIAIKRFLLYPLLYAIARPFYGLFIGKIFLKLCSIMRILPPIVTEREKHGHQSHALHAMPNACAALALEQLNSLKRINDHRRSLTTFYLEACAKHGWPVLHSIRADLPLQKFPMFIPHAENIRQRLKAKNIHLHDGWVGCMICPLPKKTELSEAIFSLPTHPGTSLADASRLVTALARVLHSS